MNELRKFQSFYTIEEAVEFAEVLKEEGVDSIIETDPSLSASIGGESSDKKIHLKIKSSDFEKVTSLLESYAEKSLSNVNSDHYLFSFSDDELFEILEKFDEWGKQDYLLAKEILKKRGHEINEKLLGNLKQKRLTELSRPESGINVWVYVGYISSLFGGLFGILIGSVLTTSKKTLPDGQIIYMFDERSRRHGKKILYMAIAILIISGIYLFYQVIVS
jgi:hypothetical protein